MNLIRTALGFVLAFVVTTNIALADDVEQVAGKLFTQVEIELTKLKQEKQLNIQSIKLLVENELLQNIDDKYFAYKVLGKHLVKLTPEQKSDFVLELKNSLVSNYANSLVNYNNEKITVISSTLANSNKTASVAMKLVGKNKTTQLITKWRYSDDRSKWLMYDFVIEGISLLQSKQQELAKVLATSGADATLELLKSKNNKQ